MHTLALESALDFLDSWLAYRLRHTEITSLSVAVYHGRQVVFSNAYGLANINNATSLTPDHLFAIASQSKMFTSTAIMQLAAQGKLRLDDPVHQYLPWLAELPDTRLREITLRQLLTHRSGLLREGLDGDHWLFDKPFPDSKQLRNIVQTGGLAFDPNTKTKYSNVGFALLGQVVETVAGQTYAEYVAEHIIRPLKLQNIVIDHTPTIIGRVVTGYGPPYLQQRPPLEHRDSTKAFAAATGVYATPADMCRFAAAHFFGDETLLGDQAKKEAQRSQEIVTQGYDAGHQLGLGFEILQAGERRLVGHGGHMGGHLTATFFDPHDGLAVSVMANCRDAPSTQIVYGIFEALDFFARHATAPTPKRLARLNARLHNPLSTVQVVATSGKLVAIDPDSWNPFNFAEELAYANPTTLNITTSGSIFNQGEHIRYKFNKDQLQSVRYAGITLLPD